MPRTATKVQYDDGLPPYRLYSILLDNDLKDVQELCVLSADKDCQSGVIAHIDLGVFLNKGSTNFYDNVEFIDVIERMREYAKARTGRGFYVWDSIADEIEDIRAFIGGSRVVTGFTYDGSLPDVLQKFNLDGLQKRVFSVKDWFETFRDRPMTLSQTIDYFDFWLDIDTEQGEISSATSGEKRIFRLHEKNLFLSIFLAIISHLMVNDRLVFSSNEV